MPSATSLSDLHAAGALYLFATAAPSQHDFTLQCNKSVALTDAVRAACAALFAYCIKHGFFDFDHETESQAPSFFLDSFLEAAAAADNTGGGDALVQWDNLGKLYNATQHADACVATASYIAQLENPADRVVQWQSSPPFPTMSSDAEQNISDVELWLQTHFVQFYSKQNRMKRHMARHITALLHEQTLEADLAKLQAEQKRIAASMAAAQRSLEKIQKPDHKNAKIQVVRKLQKRLLAGLASAADATPVMSPNKKQRKLAQLATAHLHKTLGPTFEASSMYTMYADPALLADNASALDTVHAETSKHAGEPAATHNALPDESESVHINYKFRASAEQTI